MTGQVRAEALRATALLGLACTSAPVRAPLPPPPTVAALHGTTVQRGHTEAITAARMSPDGRLVLSASEDATVRLWDVATGKELRTFSHDDEVTSIAFAPDLRRFVSGCRDNQIRVWDLAAGTLLRTLSGHTDVVGAVAFSPDGTRVASGGADRTVRLWDAGSGRQLDAIRVEGRPVAVAFSPDGRSILAGAEGGIVRMWSIATRAARSFHGHDGSVTSVVFSTDGTLILSGGRDRTLRLWEVSTGRELGVLRGHTDEVQAVALSPDGRQLLSGGRDGRVLLWDAAAGRPLRQLTGPVGQVTSVGFSPDGRHAFAAGRGDTIRLWELAGGTQVRAFSGQTYGVDAVAFAADGKHVLAVSDDGGTRGLVRVWDVSSAKMLHMLGDGAERTRVDAVALSPDGRHAVTAAWGDQVRLWTVTTGQPRAFAARVPSVTAVAFSADGRRVLAGSADGIRQFDVDRATAIGAPIGVRRIGVPGTHRLTALMSSRDGRRISFALLPVTGAQGSAVLASHDLGANRQRIIPVDLPEPDTAATTTAAAFSPDGARGVTATSYRDLRNVGDRAGLNRTRTVLRLWDMSTGKLVRSLPPQAGRISAVAFSADGRRVVTGGTDKLVRMWDPAAGRLLRVFAGHSDEVTSVAFSPDGAHILSGSDDGSSRLWRADSGASMVMLSSKREDWIVFTDEGLFDASPRGAELVAMVEGTRGHGIDQLALANNRPDAILAMMGLGTAELRAHFRAVYERRLRKAGVSAAELAATRSLPTAVIDASSMLPSGTEVEVSFTLSDRRGLRSYQVYVNDVPLFEGLGAAVSGRRLTMRTRVALTQGDNKIEISAFNMGGRESLRALHLVRCDVPTPGDLYFVGFGVSDYRDPAIPDLAYAHADVGRLAARFARVRGYQAVRIHAHTDAQVTVQAIREAKQRLMTTRPADTVVLFIAGHGVHESSAAATYYYITHDTRVDDLAGSAASFEMVEDLLAGIPARRKLFLIDTCESGDVDEAIETRQLADATHRGLAARAARVLVLIPGERTAHRARPYLLARDRFIHRDLFRRTGAVVFSSSRGGEFSYESDAVGAGLFTAALDAALAGAADRDASGAVDIEELRAAVGAEVARTSGGLQNPTIDRDNLSLRLEFSAR